MINHCLNHWLLLPSSCSFLERIDESSKLNTAPHQLPSKIDLAPNKLSILHRSPSPLNPPHKPPPTTIQPPSPQHLTQPNLPFPSLHTPSSPTPPNHHPTSFPSPPQITTHVSLLPLSIRTYSPLTTNALHQRTHLPPRRRTHESGIRHFPAKRHGEGVCVGTCCVGGGEEETHSWSMRWKRWGRWGYIRSVDVWRWVFVGVRAASGCWGRGFGFIGCVVGWGYCVDLGVFGSLGSVERGLWCLVRVGSMDRTFLGR